MDGTPTGISPEQILGVLRRRFPWILLCFIVATGAAYVVSRHQAKKYTATASLVFNNSQTGLQLAGLQPAGTNETQQAIQNTNLKLVQLGDIAEKTASIVGRDLTKAAVASDLSVTSQGESNIVDVAATATSPNVAAEIANVYTQQFVDEQQTSNHKYYSGALSLVEKQLAAMSPNERAGTVGLALQDRVQSLGILAELRNGNVQVAQAAPVPTSPSSPKTFRNTVLGAVIGLLLGLAVAFLLERVDQRIRDPKELEEVYRLPLLGVVPQSPALARTAHGKGAPRTLLPTADAEAFHLIRAHLRYFNVDRELQILMVASAAPGDGKSTISRHLAAAAASVGSSVIVVDADLRHPTLARQLDVDGGPGLSDVLIGAVPLSAAVQHIEPDDEGDSVWRGRRLDVLVAGAEAPPNPAELIESHAMQALLAQLRQTYDLVVIDTPPLTVVSDAFPLLSKVDGVIVVGRVGRNRRDVAERLCQTLNGADAPMLGVVANGLRPAKLGYGAYSYAYRYGYGDDGRGPDARANGTTRPRPKSASKT